MFKDLLAPMIISALVLTIYSLFNRGDKEKKYYYKMIVGFLIGITSYIMVKSILF